MSDYLNTDWLIKNNDWLFMDGNWLFLINKTSGNERRDEGDDEGNILVRMNINLNKIWIIDLQKKARNTNKCVIQS